MSMGKNHQLRVESIIHRLVPGCYARDMHAYSYSTGLVLSNFQYQISDTQTSIFDAFCMFVGSSPIWFSGSRAQSSSFLSTIYSHLCCFICALLFFNPTMANSPQRRKRSHFTYGISPAFSHRNHCGCTPPRPGQRCQIRWIRRG